MRKPNFLVKINQEVFYRSSKTIDFSKSKNYLKYISNLNSRGTARICFHENIDSKLHQMMICHQKKFNVLPHIHFKKEELCLVIEGLLKIVLYNNIGKIIYKTKLDSKFNNFFRIPKNTYHSMKVLSKNVIFIETTQGPFKLKDTNYPSW